MAEKLIVEEEKILWKDRRRRLGLPLSFTRYEAYEDNLTLRRGFFNTVTDEILIYRIMDIQLKRSLWQKMFGVGTITLMSTDKSHPTLELKNIRQPENVRRFLSKLIENERTKKGITSREFLDDDDFEADN
jgi:uncharacterized membrane protein YdbT with pleckstrin-like domain